jgi:hypothetical protein
MAKQRKRSNRQDNVYPISVHTGTLSKARTDSDDLAVYGIYNDGGEWVLTVMAVRRTVEKLVSDRRGATRSEVRDRAVVTPMHGTLTPRDGLKIGSFDKKSDAMREINADSSSRVDTGEYVVRADDWNRSMKTHKVDRNDFREFLRKRCVRKVRD